jgi:diguanylate cyclase (GGDEF)-like protein
MVDIDDFEDQRQVRHPWNLVLRGLVEELRRGVREMDTVARYGGEEFALILPETPEDRALVVAERLRQRIAARLFVTPELSHPLSVTVSMGLATYPDDASNKRLLVERADQALYKAKRNGKNCVVRAPDLDIQPG